jgi:hypothetical protein
MTRFEELGMKLLVGLVAFSTCQLAQAINFDMSIGTGLTLGSAYHATPSSEIPPPKMQYNAQHYMVGFTSALFERLSLSYGADFVVLYAENEASQVIRYGGAVAQSYHLFGASRANHFGGDDLSITEISNYSISIQIKEKLKRFNAKFNEGVNKIDGTTLAILLGFELRFPLGATSGFGFSQNSTIAALPFGSDLLRSEEKQSTLFFDLLW